MPAADGGVRFGSRYVCGERSVPNEMPVGYVLGHWADATPINARNERARMVSGVLVTAGGGRLDDKSHRHRAGGR